MSTDSQINPSSQLTDFTLSKSSSLMIDFVRGMSAQAVVVGHALRFFDIEMRLPWIQNSAVVIFFLLSGFVIPYSTFSKTRRDSAYSFASYMIDRFSRIYVGFIPGLIFVALVDLLSQWLYPGHYAYSPAFNLRTLVGNLLMLQDYPLLPILAKISGYSAITITSFGSARPFWTVAIEWWIYLAFGWLALGRKLQLHKTVYLIVLFFLSVVPVYNLIGGRGNGLTLVWIIGAIAYSASSRATIKTSVRESLIWGGLFIGLALARLFVTREAYDPLYAILLGLSLYFFVNGLRSDSQVDASGLVPRSVKFNAGFSYTLYLVHYSTLDLLAHARGQLPDIALFFIGFVTSNLVAIALSVMFEMKYKRVAQEIKQLWAKRHGKTASELACQSRS